MSHLQSKAEETNKALVARPCLMAFQEFTEIMVIHHRNHGDDSVYGSYIAGWWFEPL